MIFFSPKFILVILCKYHAFNTGIGPFSNENNFLFNKLVIAFKTGLKKRKLNEDFKIAIIYIFDFIDPAT